MLLCFVLDLRSFQKVSKKGKTTSWGYLLCVKGLTEQFFLRLKQENHRKPIENPEKTIENPPTHFTKSLRQHDVKPTMFGVEIGSKSFQVQMGDYLKGSFTKTPKGAMLFGWF